MYKKDNISRPSVIEPRNINCFNILKNVIHYINKNYIIISIKHLKNIWQNPIPIPDTSV